MPPNETLTGHAKTEPLFSIRNLSKVFPAGETPPGGKGGALFYALEDINLDIFPGECLMIAGSNGSGKTLLMKIIAGLTDSSGGEALYRGRPLARSPAELRTGVGLVFQDADAQIVGETVREDAAFGPRNLGLSRAEAAGAAEKALEAAGLAEKLDAPARRLSGGEKRRLAVAGVLAMGSIGDRGSIGDQGGKMVIFDEPFANLDWPGIKSVLGVIRDLKQSGRTVVILTHELEKALALADRLVILHRGRIRDDGAPEDVLSRLREEYGVRNPLRGPVSRIADCSWLE
jgi:biotin transport system ATP-binding protein